MLDEYLLICTNKEHNWITKQYSVQYKFMVLLQIPKILIYFIFNKNTIMMWVTISTIKIQTMYILFIKRKRKY